MEIRWSSVISGALGTLLTGAIGWLFWSVVDLESRMAVMEFWQKWHGISP